MGQKRQRGTEWLWVPGYEGRYIVSEKGEVVSLPGLSPSEKRGVSLRCNHGVTLYNTEGCKHFRPQTLVKSLFGDAPIECDEPPQGADEPEEVRQRIVEEPKRKSLFSRIFGR